jgi:hypothetical protein
MFVLPKDWTSLSLVSQGVVCVYCVYVGSLLNFRVCFFVIHLGTTFYAFVHRKKKGFRVKFHDFWTRNREISQNFSTSDIVKWNLVQTNV